TAEEEKTSANSQSGAGPQAAVCSLGIAPPWRLLRRPSVCRLKASSFRQHRSVCDGCKGNSASSFILCPSRTFSDGATEIRITLCATSTNRRLSATYSHTPLDRCAFFHR